MKLQTVAILMSLVMWKYVQSNAQTQYFFPAPYGMDCTF